MTLHHFDVLMTLMTALAQRYPGANVNQEAFDALIVAADEVVAANKEPPVKAVADDELTIDRAPGWEAA